MDLSLMEAKLLDCNNVSKLTYYLAHFNLTLGYFF